MTEFVLPIETHDRIGTAAYRRRGYTEDEASQAVRIGQLAAWHGIKSHNLIKALKLDDHFGSVRKGSPGCVPGATIEKLSTSGRKFPATERWNANRKLGQAVAFEAIETCMTLADRYGVGVVVVDQAFHYLWGGGYVMEAAKRGYIAYTNCTSPLAEVVPFAGKFPTLGTNPHSWGFPTMDAVGFPMVIDWATSVIAMGRVEQFAREGQPLPPDAAVDTDGKPTTDPARVAALLPFGAHKGYGLGLINELMAALIGGSLPTIRSRPDQAPPGEKTTASFFFQVFHPEALGCGVFGCQRTQAENIKAVIRDILGHGNDHCMLPGQVEHEASLRSASAQGLIFTEAEIEELKRIAEACGQSLDPATLKPLLTYT